MKRHILVFTFAALASLAATPSAVAQVNPQLDHWLGCWRLEDDLAGTGARMCITPEANGVRLQTLAGTIRGIDEIVIPDGVTRPIADSECKGSERAEWSRDGQRVFRTTEVTCRNETPRTIKGVAFLAPGPMWINVQHVSGNGAAVSVRVQRYRRAVNQALADGTKAPQPTGTTALAEAAWSVEDVIEASQKLPAEALQGALTDVRQTFNVNRKALLAMDEAGVPDSVIDLLVALSFPQRFVVERVASSAPLGITTGMGWYDPFMSPFLGGMSTSCFTTGRYYGYRTYYDLCTPHMYGYSYYPYSYSYRPYDYYSYYGNGGWVAIGSNTGGAVVSPSGEGRVVNGRGYTQIRPRTPEPSVPRTSSRGDGSSAGWSGRGSSGSGGVSSSGYSGGSSSGGSSGGSSSGGGGERVAVPRPPGGN